MDDDYLDNIVKKELDDTEKEKSIKFLTDYARRDRKDSFRILQYDSDLEKGDVTIILVGGALAREIYSDVATKFNIED